MVGSVSSCAVEFAVKLFAPFYKPVRFSDVCTVLLLQNDYLYQDTDAFWFNFILYYLSGLSAAVLRHIVWCHLSCDVFWLCTQHSECLPSLSSVVSFSFSCWVSFEILSFLAGFPLQTIFTTVYIILVVMCLLTGVALVPTVNGILRLCHIVLWDSLFLDVWRV